MDSLGCIRPLKEGIDLNFELQIIVYAFDFFADDDNEFLLWAVMNFLLDGKGWCCPIDLFQFHDLILNLNCNLNGELVDALVHPNAIMVTESVYAIL